MNLLKYLFNLKYRVFCQKIKKVQIAIWELDFKIMKSRQIREGVRQDRERSVEAIPKIQAAVDAENDPKKKEELQAELTKVQEDVKRYEAQMLMVDKQINGFVGSETEDPIVGIVEEIASLAELREMYKEFLTTI